MKQVEFLKDVIFTNLNYWEIPITEKSLIYCDPPYANTTKYKEKFNHENFWNWVREQSKLGHSIFVSEYNAPEDFICIKEIQHKTILNKNSQDIRVEKLFTI